jgi:phosphoribosyl 1,2-cyclic phosphodiesterase
VRGSIPVPGPSTLRYGGNTPCVEVRADDELIVLDAGTGIRELGIALEKEFASKPIKVTLLITHPHWDHIHGFPFFAPSYNNKNEIRILGYDGAGTGTCEALKGEMATPFFPVALTDLPGKLDIEKLQSNVFNVGKIRIESKVMNHPGICVGYRLFSSTGSVAYLPDNETYDSLKIHAAEPQPLTLEQSKQRAKQARAELVKFLRGSDILLLDAQYTDQEYQSHIGWGHSSLTSSVALAIDAAVRKLVLFHHDPNHDDHEIDAMLDQARTIAANKGASVEVEAAREGAEFTF